MKLKNENVSIEKLNIRKEVNKMEQEKKKINWLGLLIEVAKVVVSFIAGTQI